MSHTAGSHIEPISRLGSSVAIQIHTDPVFFFVDDLCFITLYLLAIIPGGLCCYELDVSSNFCVALMFTDFCMKWSSLSA
jgi:hypothetical protein